MKEYAAGKTYSSKKSGLQNNDEGEFKYEAAANVNPPFRGENSNRLPAQVHKGKSKINSANKFTSQAMTRNQGTKIVFPRPAK